MVITDTCVFLSRETAHDYSRNSSRIDVYLIVEKSTGVIGGWRILWFRLSISWRRMSENHSKGGTPTTLILYRARTLLEDFFGTLTEQRVPSSTKQPRVHAFQRLEGEERSFFRFALSSTGAFARQTPNRILG